MTYYYNFKNGVLFAKVPVVPSAPVRQSETLKTVLSVKALLLCPEAEA